MHGSDVFITGVHSGLGLGLARRALARGARVHGVSRHAPDEALRFAALDLTRFEAIAPTLGELLDGVARLELVVLNAGTLGEIQPLAATSHDDWRRVMELNVWANKVVLDALLDGTREVGHVIAVSSGAAVNGSAGWGSYAMSKAALNLLLQVAAGEHPEVHFSAVAPGIVETAMIEQVVASPDSPSVERIRRTLADKRSFTPEAAADAIYERLAAIREAGSGAFVDIRDLM